MKPLKRLVVICAIIIFFMLILPIILVNTVKAEAGMFAVIVMFFAVNPIASAVSGILAGNDLKHLWITPFAVAILFRVFSSFTFQTAFPIVYSLAYFVICTIAMIITHVIHKTKKDYKKYKNKKSDILTLCLAFMLLLCSCTKIPSENVIEQVIPESENFEEAEETANTVYVSPIAEENFLLPLEDFSWEREHAPEYVMLHFTSNVVNNMQNPFDIEAIRNIFVSGGVSINYIIDREGKIQCWIPENRAAWHAGRGSFANDEKYTNAMNKYSIGIELAATGSQKDMAQYLTSYEYSLLDESFIGFTSAQYDSLSLLVKDICARNGIPFDREHVIGHDEYNPEKSDPGELFDWGKLMKQ